MLCSNQLSYITTKRGIVQISCRLVNDQFENLSNSFCYPKLCGQPDLGLVVIFENADVGIDEKT